MGFYNGDFPCPRVAHSFSAKMNYRRGTFLFFQDCHSFSIRFIRDGGTSSITETTPGTLLRNAADGTSTIKIGEDMIVTRDDNGTQLKFNTDQIEVTNEIRDYHFIKIKSGLSLILPKSKLEDPEDINPPIPLSPLYPYTPIPPYPPYPLYLLPSPLRVMPLTDSSA